MYAAAGRLSERRDICSDMDSETDCRSERLSASIWLASSPDPPPEQNAQPPYPQVPSLLGHVKPASILSLTVLRPNCFRSSEPIELNLTPPCMIPDNELPKRKAFCFNRTADVL